MPGDGPAYDPDFAPWQATGGMPPGQFTQPTQPGTQIPESTTVDIEDNGTPNPVTDPLELALLGAAGQQWNPTTGQWEDAPLSDFDQAVQDWTMSQMGMVQDETGQWVMGEEEEGLPELTEEQLANFDTMEQTALTQLQTTLEKGYERTTERTMADLAARGILVPGTEESTVFGRTMADLGEQQGQFLTQGATAIAGQKAVGMLDYQMGIGGYETARAGMTSQAVLGGAGWQQQGGWNRMQGLGNIWGIQQAGIQSEADRALALNIARRQASTARRGQELGFASSMFGSFMEGGPDLSIFGM